MPLAWLQCHYDVAIGAGPNWPSLFIDVTVTSGSGLVPEYIAFAHNNTKV